jgi:hypothetical protein
MQSSSNKQTRKKFLWWGTALLASIAAVKWMPGRRKAKASTAKLLTQDGKLVEIDKRFLVSSGKKISNKELQQWVHTNQSSNNSKHGQ